MSINLETAAGASSEGSYSQSVILEEVLVGANILRADAQRLLREIDAGKHAELKSMLGPPSGDAQLDYTLGEIEAAAKRALRGPSKLVIGAAAVGALGLLWFMTKGGE